jgi:uncharacterized protein
MGERTGYAPGTFSWVDLATPDAGSAKSFYSDLFGWQSEDMPGEAGTYTIFRLDGKDVAGCFGQGQGEGMPPHWNSYVTVEDADGAVSRATELGGSTLMEPRDVEGGGRMGVIADPAGAPLALWEPRGQIGAGLVNVPGALCWNDLATTDVDGAMTFYGGLLGWTFTDVPAPQRRYRIRNRESDNGSLYLQSEEERSMPPNWLAYFATAYLDATSSTLARLGGRVIVEPLDVPAGRLAVATDPQGAALGLFEGRLDP